MTLGDLMGALAAPDCFEGGAMFPLDVVFDTAGESDLTVLSVYYAREDGKIHVDIGEANG